MALLLILTGDTAGHLAVAVRRHREVLAHLDRAVPPELEQLEACLAGVARGSLEPSSTGVPPECGRVPLMSREWLSVAEAAQVAGLSESSIRRAFASGLPSSKVGRSRRVHRRDLAEFLRERAS